MYIMGHVVKILKPDIRYVFPAAAKKNDITREKLVTKAWLVFRGLMIKCLGAYSLHRRENGRLIHKCHCKGRGCKGEVGKAISFVRPPFHTAELQQRQEL